VEPLLNQADLSLKIKTPLGEDGVILDRLEGIEELSKPFEFILQLHSASDDIDFDDLLGKEITATLESINGQRHFSGIVGKIEQNQTINNANDNQRAYYQATIYPKFWLTKLTCDHRIFQNMSAIDIIMGLLKENHVTNVQNQVSECGQNPREFCVQYGESVFDFVSRLMEEEGIFYFFTHQADKHTMVLSDGSQAPEPLEQNIHLALSQPAQFLLNTILQFNYRRQVVAKTFKAVDFNYLTPATHLSPQSPGTGLGGVVYEFPGLFEDMDQGEAITNHRIQELEWAATLAQGTSTVPDFAMGKTFSLTQHPRSDFNQDYVLYRVKHSIYQKSLPEEESDYDNKDKPYLSKIYENEFLAFPASTPFRPSRSTPKKRIYSNQTAIVTGPKGEEVFCDEYGRIKIHFHWDLKNALNENSSCWVRVAQNWAGGGWGGLVTPRIGMEVVVTFIEGDPDRPLVIGCVYNGKNNPPDYAKESPTKSTFKTNTSKGGHGYNEVRFEDKKGEEEIFTHAQKDVNTIIEHSRTEDIKTGNDTLTIHKGSRYITQKGHGTLYSLKISNGDDKIHIDKGNKKTTIDSGDHTVEITSGNYKITLVKGNMTIKVNGDIKVDSTKNISFKALKNINLEAGMNIQMKAGKSIQSKAGLQIKNEAGQSIQSKAGMQIKSEAGMMMQLKAGMEMKSEAGMVMQIKGGMMTKIEGGMMTQVKGGMMTQVKGGVMGQYEGGVMAMLKGVLAKIN